MKRGVTPSQYRECTDIRLLGEGMTIPVRTGVVVYFAALLWLNLFVIPYPADNDLQFIGWMAEHLRLSRLESLVSRNYPFPMGFPPMMRGLTPLFGSIIQAALFCQTVVSALGLLLVYAITRKIF